MNAKKVAKILNEIALLGQLAGESAFKVRAYSNAARTIEGLEDDLDALVAQKKVQSLKGIGKSIASKITELVTTGKLPYLDELRDQIPCDIAEWIKIPGMGPKKIRVIVDGLDISTIDALAEACKNGEVAALDGFGKKSEEKILKGIDLVRRHSGRYLQSLVRPEADRLLALVRSHEQVMRAEVCGSVRRGCETSKDVDILAAAEEGIDALMDAFVADERVEDLIARGPTKCSVRLQSGLNVDLRVVADENYPFALQYFTGSKAHNVSLRGRTIQLGYKLNEYALTRTDDGHAVPCDDEADIYEALGLAWVPPEMREDAGELAAAEKREIPTLVAEGDLRGAVHCHTTASDGTATLEEMVEAAKARGLDYIVISDHSRSAAYARGLSVEAVEAQWEAIDALREKQKDGFQIIKAIECDILPDGRLDYDDDFLATFDLVIAAVHSHFTLSEEDQTARMVEAVRHPATNILAHPSGRLLLSRDPYPVKLRAVLDAAAESGVAVEINAQPDRLDLDWQQIRYALSRGIKLVVSVDAHSTSQLDLAAHGVRTARKGWCTKGDILNTLSAEALLAHFDSHRRPRSSTDEL